jgi:PTS system fructose-specific IIC component
MKLLELFPRQNILLDLKARDTKGTFKEIIAHLEQTGAVTEEVGKKLERAVTKRESEGSTGVGKGLALPHAKGCSFISEMIAVYARSKTGVSFNAVVGASAHLVFFVASPVHLADQHLVVMKKIVTLHRDDKTLKFLKTSDKIESVLEILREIDEKFI